MSQGEELLNTLSEEDISLYSANPDTEEHIVVGADRFITVPASLQRLAVQYDHNVETVTFDCPRYWDGLDMSKLVVVINYIRPDGQTGSYPATNIRVDETDTNSMHFDWTIDWHVTEAFGNLTFLVCIRKSDEDGNDINHWNSELNTTAKISKGLDCEGTIADRYPSLVTQLLTRLGTVESKVGTYDSDIANLKAKGGTHDLEIDALNAQTDDLYSMAIDLQGRVGTLEEGCGTAPEVDLSAIEADISTLKTDVEGIKTTDETQQASIDGLTTRLDEMSLATTGLDFAGWNDGSFVETLSDGSTITHTVEFDAEGNVTKVGGISIGGLA